MATLSWPLTLPQLPLVGAGTSAGGPRVLSMPMDRGEPLTEYQGAQGADWPSLPYMMTTAQTATAINFIDNTLRGVAVFNLPNPDTATGGTLEVQLRPVDGDRYWRRDRAVPGYWIFTIAVRVMT